MARESAHIRASCVEATEFMELSRKFRVTGVPKTIVNGSTEILGALPEELFVRGVLGLPEADRPRTRSTVDSQFAFAGAAPASIVAVFTKSSFGYSASR